MLSLRPGFRTITKGLAPYALRHARILEPNRAAWAAHEGKISGNLRRRFMGLLGVPLRVVGRAVLAEPSMLAAVRGIRFVQATRILHAGSANRAMPDFLGRLPL